MNIQELSLNKIKLNKNSRLLMHPEDMSSLMQSIKEVGLLQPIGVVKKKNAFEVCYGNRRFLAASKLGMKSIPAVVYENTKESLDDLRNLTENVQRKNISLLEVGRYIEILKKESMGIKEIAVKLGVSKGYLEDCRNAYSRVPDKYKSDIEIRNNKNKKRTPGKIALSTANRIEALRTKYALKVPQVDTLYRMAKDEDRFDAERIAIYAEALADGETNVDTILSKAPRKSRVAVNMWIDVKELEELKRKYVENGPFNTFTGLVISVLRGEVNQKMNVR